MGCFKPLKVLANLTRALEQNLDSTCQSPQLHQDDLLRFVHPPEIVPICYKANTSPPSQLLLRLKDMYNATDILQDPYIQYLQMQNTIEASKDIVRLCKSRKTKCNDEIKTLTNTALQLDQELGAWASSLYISCSISRFRNTSAEFCGSGTIEEREMLFLLAKFAQLNAPTPNVNDLNFDLLSPKVSQLLDLLSNELRGNTVGILFVKTRAAVSVLSVLLTFHPRVKDILRVGTYVGTSSYQCRKARATDLISTSDQDRALKELKSGAKNLIVSTSVLEEGIDVTACNRVFCFERPATLKSFVQRRGRARHEESKYIVMFPEQDLSYLREWQEMENMVKQLFANTEREIQELKALEASDQGYRQFRIPKTG